eukprot:jgi/Botrbrau1/14611/Bobra.67_2s0011.1
MQLQALAVIDCLEGSNGELWKQYMRISMQPEIEQTIPLCLSEKQLAEIGDPLLADSIREIKAQIKAQMEQVPQFSDLEQGDPSLIIRAYAHVQSRAVLWTKKVADSKKVEYFAIVPFIEFGNHDLSQNVTCQYQMTLNLTRTDSFNSVDLMTRLAPPLGIQKGEQASYSYDESVDVTSFFRASPFSNFDTFLLYGFVFDSNPKDALEIPENLPEGCSSAIKRGAEKLEPLRKINQDWRTQIGSDRHAHEDFGGLCHVHVENIVVALARLNSSAQQELDQVPSAADAVEMGEDAVVAAMARTSPSVQRDVINQYRRQRRYLLETTIQLLDKYLPMDDDDA